MKKKFLAIFDRTEIWVPFKPGETLFTALMKAGLHVHSTCGQMGICTACKIFLAAESIHPPLNEIEAERAEERSFSFFERLSCQIEAQEGLIVEWMSPSQHKS